MTEQEIHDRAREVDAHVHEMIDAQIEELAANMGLTLDQARRYLLFTCAMTNVPLWQTLDVVLTFERTRSYQEKNNG